MSNNSLAQLGIASAMTLTLVVLAPPVSASNFFDWMSPGKWFGGRDRDRDYYRGYGYPGWGYGYPGWGGYGYPGWGGYGYPGWGGYGYPGWGYGYPIQQQKNDTPAPPPVPQ